MELIYRHQPPCFISQAAKQVLDYLAQTDLSKLPNGSHLINGETFYVNIFHYTTAESEARIWEAHQKYLDIHLVLEGQETVCQAFLPTVETGEYQSETDYLPIAQQTKAQTRFLLTPDELAIFAPEDAHQTGLIVEKPQKIRKAVFKRLIKP
ncbi:YhcH/YjgK/YiaL family protein [Suttonella ornithocola]|uniref:Uncharacterized protein, YhcH/YjgK/YiaL family n=1 Tax=Suttonella ornithocola TaxID=279832 RepID=A0A380MZ58_9GAMM|nr:YhcH/YjgK/YiaL family protein [Suttonella ornithocola]SUO97592.1 uncharacterized protein, YhcH/YjgK/YiaL family [Suttonella ornithocola]